VRAERRAERTVGRSGPLRPFLCGVGTGGGLEDYEPDVDPLLPPDGGGPPSAEGLPDPDGGVPVPDFDPLPMFGQFLVEPDPALELELEPELDGVVPVPPVFELPVFVLPVFVLPVFELDDGALDEVEPELLPELPVVVDVVAALATSAPPATRPEVSAPMASTLRRRSCMCGALSSVWSAGPLGPVPHTVRRGSERSRRTRLAGARSRATNA
jgi:hypothetical protein